MTPLRKSAVVLLLLFFSFSLFGCAKEAGDAKKEAGKANEAQQAEIKELDKGNTALQQLLPEKEGFHWVYDGFAEYSHTMDLKELKKEGSRIEYDIDGEIADMSGGASARDFSLEVEYVIKDGVLTQQKNEELMLDSISDNIQLLKAPLSKGARWQQTATSRDGKKLSLNCQITEITGENGLKEYTVIYDDQNSDYFERRKIREGTGVVSFEKRITNKGESFVAGYTLNEEASGPRDPEAGKQD